MQSISPTSQLPITREYIKNPPRLFVSNFAARQRLSRSINFPSMSSMSVMNDSSRKREPVIQEKDAMIIVDHGSRRHESNLMLNDFVAMFKSRTGYQIVEPAHMELAEPAIKDAFRRCVLQGANRVIVSPFFLLPGRHWHQDIPALVAEAAGEHSGTSYVITAPLGLHELMVVCIRICMGAYGHILIEDVMNDRIKHCLSHVAGNADECAMCAGTGRCRLYSR